MKGTSLTAATVLIWAAALAAHAQPRIGVLAFTQIGAILIEWRGAGGSNQQAKAHAHELVRLRVKLIVAMATPAVQAARDATSSIPIVMAPAGDPMRFVASLARPGGNVTGIAGFGPDLAGKRIQLFQEIIPGVQRIGLLTNTVDPFSRIFIAESRDAAAKAGVQLHLEDVTRSDQVDAAYARMKQAGVGAVVVQGVLTGPDWRAAELALKHRLPAQSFLGPFAHQGGLAFYSGSMAETNQRAASS